MSGRDDGGPAFPIAESLAHQVAHAALIASGAQTTEDKDRVYIAAKAVALRGMSLRDHFAGLAMAAIIAEPQWGTDTKSLHQLLSGKPSATESIAVAAVKVADALIAELAKA